MNSAEIIDIYIPESLPKISKEDKTNVLMGDFNVDLLKCDINTDSATFLDSMYTHFLFPYISTPTRVTTQSKILIDNIFSNNIDDGLISGNITTTITDHYAQLLLKKDIKLQHTIQILFRHNLKNFNDAQFDYELKSTDCVTVLEADKKDIDISFNKFLLKFNNLLQQNAPLKKL